jgi:hypothetical protein
MSVDFLILHHERPKFVVPGVKMVRRVNETVRAIQWTCAAASTEPADRILMLLMIQKQNRGYSKTRITKAHFTRVTCT